MLISMIFYDKRYLKYLKYEIKLSRWKVISPYVFSSKYLHATNPSFVPIISHWAIRNTSGEGWAWMCKLFEVGDIQTKISKNQPFSRNPLNILLLNL